MYKKNQLLSCTERKLERRKWCTGFGIGKKRTVPNRE